MPTYFNSIDTLHHFTMNLDCHQHELQCHCCAKNNQFVSHGFVYRQLSSTKNVIVGKRIFCANRHGKTGCGTTHQLYLSTIIPSLHYSTEHLLLFLQSLIALCTIQDAYEIATGTTDPRNAYRWLAKLTQQLMAFRGRIKKHTADLTNILKTKVRRLQLLLPTLQTLFSERDSNPCAHYQLQLQTVFI